MLGNLFKSIFSNTENKTEKNVEATEYKGFLIYPESRAEGSQYRLAGRICKNIDGEVKTHQFIRSDMLGSQEEADQFMLRKAQMFIDQTGDKMFS